jgi:hypothetical protein
VEVSWSQRGRTGMASAGSHVLCEINGAKGLFLSLVSLNVDEELSFTEYGVGDGLVPYHATFSSAYG